MQPKNKIKNRNKEQTIQKFEKIDTTLIPKAIFKF